MLSPLWFAANYFFNLSLGLTSVASTTILSSTSSIGTLVLSVLLLKESPDVVKFLAAVVSLVGVGLIASSDRSSGGSSMAGDLCALAGAATYSVYSVLLKLRANKTDTVLLFGCLGLVNAVVFLPGLWTWEVLGWEKLEWPGTDAWVGLSVNAALGTVVADLMWAMSVNRLSPALCTMGLSLTIPLSMLVDTFVKSASFPLQYFLGTSLILLAFVTMSLFEFPSLSALLSNHSLARRFLSFPSASESTGLKSP